MQVMPSAGRVAVPAHKATRSHRRSHVARSQQSETEQTSAPAQNTPKEVRWRCTQRHGWLVDLGQTKKENLSMMVAQARYRCLYHNLWS